MTDVLTRVLADLAAEGDRLEQLVTGLDHDRWGTPTPAEGWDVATQVAHLAWTDEVAHLAATDKATWDTVVLEAMADPSGFVDTSALEVAAASPDRLLARWRAARRTLAATLTAYPPGEKLPWFGPPMSPTSMATARFMETWAHSQDVHDALGLALDVTDRIRHVAHLGVRTRGFAFHNAGLDAPHDEVRVELVAPSGATWTWGPEGAAESVTGSAHEFCLLVTQRVHRDDTALVATGAVADRWLDVAQAFAGPPGGGRAARVGDGHE